MTVAAATVPAAMQYRAKKNIKQNFQPGIFLTPAGLQLYQPDLEPGVLLLVGVQLPLPLLHVGGGLLQRRRQPRVVVLQRGELHLPLLGVGRRLRQRQLEAVVLVL